MNNIENLKQEALTKHIPIMQDEGISFLLRFIKEHHIKHILEIGSAIGYSAIRFASISDDIYVTTIEKDEDRYMQAINNINNFNLNNRIEIINGDALDIDIEGQFDLIFIDAAKGQYIKFFEKYKNNLKDNGIIVSDNLSFHGLVADPSKIRNRNTKQLVKKIKKYIDFLKTNDEYETVFYTYGDGISISYRKNDK